MELNTIIRVLSEHDDYQTVHDTASEYGEPGYSSEGPVLMGDWWCRRADCSYPDRYDDGRRKIHALEYHYPRVFAALESAGCALEWYDEWTVVDDKAYRTSADSYSWEPTAVFNEETSEYMIRGEDIDTWLEWATNNPTRCLMSDTFSDDELAAQGFQERECDFEDGWYGQHDDPSAIMAAIQERENVDVLFKLAGVEQFRVKFCVYVRPRSGIVADVEPYDVTDWRNPETSDYCEWCDEGSDSLEEIGTHRHVFYVQRAGASNRTADDLAQTFLFDVASIVIAYEVPTELAALELESGSGSGWCEDPDMSQALSDEIVQAESALADVGLYATWDDGYVIERIELMEEVTA